MTFLHLQKDDEPAPTPPLPILSDTFTDGLELPSDPIEIDTCEAAASWQLTSA